MTITIDVFGPMSVHLEDGQAAPLQPKLQHLLGLLVAAEGQWVSLDAIIDDYWRPDALPASPRAAVQTAMSRLRTRLGDASHEIVQSTDVAYRVDRNRVDVDLWTWSSTIHEAEQGRPSRALARYRHANSIWSGAPFASVDTSPRLDDLSLRLQLTRARAARDEARHLLDAGEPAEALARLDDQLTGDLETEGPVILGMLAMAALGQVTSALGLAGRFRTELRERHGLSPSSDFVTAERELLERPPDDGRAAARRRPRPRSGRSWRTETVDLTAAAVLEAIDTSRTRVWHIVAPHGFGLTTLLRDVGERIGDERPDVGVALIRGRHADRSNPFALLASRDRDEEHGPIAEPLHAVERLVADVGDAARVIIIDDADQLDARARSVLSTLHALEPEVRLVVLAGAHSADEASVRRLPLPGELQIRLVELTEQEVAGVVERAGLASSRGEREDVARRIHRWGRGDPTSLVEALDAIRRDGPSAALPIPTPRRSAIEQAIAALDDHDAEFLRRVAVVGRSVDPIALSHVCETDVHVVIDVLDRAVDCRLLSPSPRPGEYEFSDDASRAALSERLSAGAVRRLHQRAGDWFERVGRFAQAAEHHLAAFPVEAGPDLRRLMRAAADECLERREDLRAAHWLGELAGFEPDGPERFAAQLEQCRALERAGRHDRADEILASLSDTVEATGDWDLVADVALAGAGLSSRIGGSDARRMRLERALRCLPDDHGGRSEVVAELALEHLEATRSFGPALTNQLAEVASDRQSPANLLARRVQLALGEAMAGARFEHVDELMNDLWALGPRARPIDLAGVIPLGCHVACTTGRWDEADRLLLRFEIEGRRSGLPRAVWQPKAMRAALLDAEGDHDEAAALAADAQRIGSRLDVPDAEMTFALFTLGQHYRAGAMAQFEPLLPQVDERYRRHAIYHGFLAVAQIDAGNESGAARSLAAAAEQLRGTRSLFAPAELAISTFVASMLGDVEVATTLASELVPRRGRQVFLGYGGPYLGPVDWYLGMAAAAAGANEQAHELFDSACRSPDGGRATCWIDAPLRHRHALR